MKRGSYWAAVLLAGCSPATHHTSEADAEVDAALAAADATQAAADAAADAAQAAADVADGAGPGARGGAAPASGAASRWTYTSQDSAMGDGKTSYACVVSENEVRLNWPYGNVKAELCLRNSPQFGKDAYVSLLGDGQILCRSYDGCQLRIRYGDKPARAIGGGAASDHSSNIVFLRGRSSLEQGLKGADTTAIEIEFYEAGRQAIIFPTKGFDWKP